MIVRSVSVVEYTGVQSSQSAQSWRPAKLGQSSDSPVEMAPDPRQLRSQRFPLHAAVENGDITRVRGLLEGAMG